MRIQHITFNTETGGNQTITVQDYEDNNSLEFYGEPFKEAVSGYRHSRLKGQRKNVRVSYRACVEPEVFRSLFNNIVSDLFDRELPVIRYSEGQSMSNTHELVPTDRMIHKAEYAMQHGLFLPVMEFVGRGLVGAPDVNIIFNDYGFITEAVTTALDYGLITEAVTAVDDYLTL